MKQPPIKVRFAPSPTGHLHIGGVRTAIFNYLYAKNQGGDFLVRIEDTDQERSKKEFVDEILNSLKWIGLDWDGEVEYQTKRIEVYQKYAKQLVDEGKAFRVDQDTQAIKFKMPHKKIMMRDVVKGEVEFDTSLYDDLVILKSSGFPTYNFACVVDDFEMGISHVIRGEDHVSNTPRQMVLYEALNWRLPKYAHLPLIVGDDRTPLSKRHGNVSLTPYQEDGYLPEGILNYLSLLGWGPGNNEEIFSKEALIKKFSLKRINSASASFDKKKLNYVNSEHLKQMEESDFLEKGTCFLEQIKKDPAYEQYNITKLSKERIQDILLLFRSRIKNWKDILWQAEYFFLEDINYDKDSVEKYLSEENSKQYLSQILELLKSCEQFRTSNIEALVRKLAEKLDIKAAALIHPIRVAVCGVSVSPGLFELMELLGKDIVLKRIQFTIDNVL